MNIMRIRVVLVCFLIVVTIASTCPHVYSAECNVVTLQVNHPDTARAGESLQVTSKVEVICTYGGSYIVRVDLVDARSKTTLSIVTTRYFPPPTVLTSIDPVFHSLVNTATTPNVTGYYPFEIHAYTLCCTTIAYMFQIYVSGGPP